jgi:hypothetical protein
MHASPAAGPAFFGEEPPHRLIPVCHHRRVGLRRPSSHFNDGVDRHRRPTLHHGHAAVGAARDRERARRRAAGHMHTMIEAHVTIELCLRRRGRLALSQSPASLVECTVDAFEHRSDQELLERTAHEPEAFGAFYRRHVAAVLVFFRRRTGDPQLALKGSNASGPR